MSWCISFWSSSPSWFTSTLIRKWTNGDRNRASRKRSLQYSTTMIGSCEVLSPIICLSILYAYMPASRQDNPPGLGCLSPQDRELCRISSRMVLKPPTSTEFWQDRINMVRHALDALETPRPWDGYPCRWRGGQTGRISARRVTLDCQLNMRAHISKIVSACYYHLRRIRQLRHCLDKDDRQKLVSVLACCRGSTIATSHLLDYLRFHWLLSSESSTPLLASSPTSDLATMSAMFYAIYIGYQSVSEYHI